MDRVQRLREEINKDGFDWTEDGPELLELIDIHYAVLPARAAVVTEMQEIGTIDGWPQRVIGFLPWVTMKRCWEIDNNRCNPAHFFQ